MDKYPVMAQVKQNDTVIDITQEKNKNIKVRLLLAGTCFITYFSVTQIGGEGIEKLFNLSHDSSFGPILAVGVLASLTAGGFYFRALNGIKLKPQKANEYYLLPFTPFAAAPIFTGAYLGAKTLGLPKSLCIINALISFMIRFSVVWDGAIKCPTKLKDMKCSFNNAYISRNIPNLIRLTAACLLTLGYSVSLSDAIYEASALMLSWAHVSESIILPFAYTTSGLGIVGTIPYILYWLSLGLDMLTNGKNFNDSITDRYTYIAAVMSIPSIIGILGTATSASGEVFAKLGLTAAIIRFITSVSYGIVVNTIAFSGVIRKATQRHYNPGIFSAQGSSTKVEYEPFLINDPEKDPDDVIPNSNSYGTL